jgi:hypothetical protein
VPSSNLTAVARSLRKQVDELKQLEPEPDDVLPHASGESGQEQRLAGQPVSVLIAALEANGHCGEEQRHALNQYSAARDGQPSDARAQDRAWLALLRSLAAALDSSAHLNNSSELPGAFAGIRLFSVRQEVEEAIIDYYLDMDALGCFLHPPATNEELHEFLRLAFRINIPRKRMDPGHRAPFEFVADLFFERVKNAVGFANRSGGKSLNVAALNLLDMIFKPGCEVASAGAILNQAERQYGHFCSFQQQPWFDRFCDRYQQRTGRPFSIKSIRSYTAFDTGSAMEILTGTEKGLRSPHPNKARIDEIDLMPWSLLQTALSMARSSDAARGQNVFTSTRQLEHGAMARLLEEAPRKGIEVYEWNIWEVLEKCQRRCLNDQVHGTCPIYTYCKGKAHECDGYYQIDDFINNVRLLDRETWETEWLNHKPARQKLVYAMFEPSKHVMTPKRLSEMTGFLEVQASWPKRAGIDFGASPGHAFAYIKLAQLPGGPWLAFWEYCREQQLLVDHAHAIQNSPFYTPGERIYADWQLQDRIELKAYGVRTQPANKDVPMGIDYVKSLFSGFPPREEPQLYIWHECSGLIAELNAYSWKVDRDGMPDRSGLPNKKEDDRVDALRYALFSEKHQPQQRYRAKTIRGL